MAPSKQDISLNSPVNFLHLPQNVRNKVYRLLRIKRPCHIDLLLESRRRRWMKDPRVREIFNQVMRTPSRYRCHIILERARGLRYKEGSKVRLECFCPPLPLHLLYVCRTFYKDIVPLLYGDNTFKLRGRENDKLDNSRIIWTLSSQAWASMRSLHIGINDGGRSPTQALDGNSPHGRRVVKEWNAICRHLGARVSPSRMKLCVSCQVDDINTARQIVRPLKKFPLLRGSAIYLNHDRQKEALGSIAKTTALELMGVNLHPRLNQSWDDLPKEIRVKTLEYTGLVRCWEGSLVSSDEVNVRNNGFHLGSHECCMKCTDTLSVCCCPARSASFSDKCTYDPFPSALFSVSKRMRDDATEVFYSRNRFVFRDDFSATSRFLVSLPDTTLAHIRDIDLEFSCDEVLSANTSRPGSQVAREWQRLVMVIRDRLPLQKLWLSINLGDMWQELLELDYEGGHDYGWLRTEYQQIIRPLRQLKGLKKFHVFLSWFLNYEADAEKEVMGPDYDSAAEGKLPYRLRHFRFPHQPLPKNLMQFTHNPPP